MNFLKINFLMLVVLFPLFAESVEINQLEETSSISVSNQYYDLILDVSPVPTISKFEINNKTFLKQQQKNDDNKNYGLHLSFYNHHPKHATEVIEINEPFSFSQEIKNASEKTVVLSSNSSPLAMTQRYNFNDFQSKFEINTTLKNTSQSAIEFYPSELATWDTEVGSTGMPNMNFYFNIPLLDSDQPSYNILQGADNANEIILNATHDMFYFRYKAMLNEIEMSNERSWYAVLNGSYTQPQVLAIKHEFFGKQPEMLENNFHLFSNGAGTFQQNGKTVKQDFNVEKYISSRNVIGKIVLEPNQEFSFKTTIACSVCPGPIVLVDQGVIANKPIDFEIYENSYLMFGVLGIPQEGMLAIEMLDENGELLERHTALSLMLDYLNQVSKRPGYVVPNLPTVFYHQISFGLDAEDEKVIDHAEKVMSETRTIEVYLTDFNKNNLFLIGKDEYPFETFKIPENVMYIEKKNQTN